MPGQFSPAEPLSALITSPSWSAGPRPQPFHFRSRTEPMDWRRMASLDVDRVAREMDVNVLQEFITAVTFCDVEGERCPHCRGPTDTALLKVLRMSQLSTEYLLHCQDYLSTQMSMLEEHLQGALSQAQQEAEKRAQLEKELQEVKLESRRRKKMIATQQLLLQTSANNYHKCQFCEKSFVNYSYLQSHIQRRHPEITDTERQKKRQVEQMEDGIEELKEKLRLTQIRLAAEKEADAHHRQQELEEQRRREFVEREAMERWKEEERRKFQQEIEELRQLFLQEFKGIANKSYSMEAKLQELENREVHVSNMRSEDDHEKEQRQLREKELKEQMTQKKNEWRKKLKEMQNLHQQEKEELQSENARLLNSLSEEHSSSSSLHALKQQLLSLSSELKQKDRLIHLQKQKIKKLSSKSLSVNYSEPPPNITQKAYTSPEEENDDDKEEEEERLEDSIEAQRKVLESLRGNPELVKEFRPILEETLEERLEKMGLRKGTKGISKQTLKSLSSLVSAQRLQGTRQSNLQDLRGSLVQELNRRMRHLQKNPTKSTTSTNTQQRKKPLSPSVEMSPKLRQVSSKPSSQKASTHQPPTPAPRSKAHTPTSQTRQKKSSTPPFSSEEDESAEDSAYITSSRGKPSHSAHLTPSGKQQKPSSELDWSDSDESDGSDTPKDQQVSGTHGSVVQTLTRSLEKQLSSSLTKPAGGIQVLPPASLPSSRPSFVKQQAVSEEESDLELSSIEELAGLPTGAQKSPDVGGIPRTSVWGSAASRARGW